MDDVPKFWEVKELLLSDIVNDKAKISSQAIFTLNISRATHDRDKK